MFGDEVILRVPRDESARGRRPSSAHQLKVLPSLPRQEESTRFLLRHTIRLCLCLCVTLPCREPCRQPVREAPEHTVVQRIDFLVPHKRPKDSVAVYEEGQSSPGPLIVSRLHECFDFRAKSHIEDMQWGFFPQKMCRILC